MIKRDFYGLIVQHDPNDLNYSDGGDSSRSTGIMATFGSRIDRALIIKHHLGNGILVRHPFQKEWSNPKNFSRDQMIPLISGFAGCKDDGILKLVFYASLKRFGLAQNGDLLNPAVFGQLILGSRLMGFYWVLPLAYLWHYLEILYNCKIAPEKEQNQLMCRCRQFGTEGFFKKLHPDWKKAVNDYWSNYPFRDQKEVADQIIENF